MGVSALNGALWKCRTVENEENQTTVSHRFPPRLEIANTAIPTFPQGRRFGVCSERREAQRDPYEAAHIRRAEFTSLAFARLV